MDFKEHEWISRDFKRFQGISRKSGLLSIFRISNISDISCMSGILKDQQILRDFIRKVLSNVLRLSFSWMDLRIYQYFRTCLFRCRKSGFGGPETPRPPYLEKSRFDWVFLNAGLAYIFEEYHWMWCHWSKISLLWKNDK